MLVGILLASTACGEGEGAEVGDGPHGSQSVASDSDTASERSRLVAQCLQDRGWDVEVDELDGSIHGVSLPEDQAALFYGDADECSAKYPYVEPEHTREAAENYYEALVATGECLTEMGFDVEAPPSEESSVESMLSGTMIDPLWDPYDAVSGQSMELGGLVDVGVREAQTECPQPSFGG